MLRCKQLTNVLGTLIIYIYIYIYIYMYEREREREREIANSSEYTHRRKM